MKYKEIIRKLRSLSNPKNVEGMARFGINPKNCLGVNIPILRAIAGKTGKNHKLANKLWSSKYHEVKILASMVADPKLTTEKQMDKWVKDFDSWDVCDQVIMNLFEDIPIAYKKAIEWSKNKEEFIRRAGFVMMARLAVSDKKTDNGKFEKFYPLIIKYSTDERNFVKKAVNWAIRQIGKRDKEMNKKMISLSKKVIKINSRSAKWIASGAIRELKDSKIRKRLK